MEIKDRHALGDLPLQDHRGTYTDFAPHLRACVVAARVESRTIFGNYVAAGHDGSQAKVKTIGDLLGGFHFQKEDGKRATGAWAFVLPVVATEASKKPKNKPSDDPRVTITRGAANAAAKKDRRKVKVRPVRNDLWEEDDRFKELSPVAHPLAPSFPKGTPGVVLCATAEREQNELFLPSLGNALISVNYAGDPGLSTIVYDLTKDDELNDLRNAPLHSFWEVVLPAGGCAIGGQDGALAWQLGVSGQDGIAGRGLVIDSPGSRTVHEEKDLEPDSTESEDARYGAVTFVNEYLARQRAQYNAARNRDDQTRTRTRTPGSTQTRTDPPANDPNPNPLTGAAKVLAAMSARSSGPIEVGEAGDRHEIGTTKDGYPINAAHVSIGALFKGMQGDGPLEFDPQDYEDDQGLPFYVPVKLRWDPASSHEWVCGVAPGKWRWQAQSPIYFPEDPPRTTTPGGGGTPPPPWWSREPPKDCQTIPGPVVGGGTGTGGIDVGFPGVGAGELPLAPGIGELIKRALDGGSTLPPLSPGIGELIKRGLDLGPDDSGLDPGSGPPLEPGIGGVIKGDGDDDAGPFPGTGTEGPGIPWPNGGGEIPPSIPGTITPGGGGSTTRERQKDQSKYSTLERQLQIPIGSLTSGGAQLPPGRLYELKAQGVLDSGGIPLNAVPRVGDGPKRLRDLLGGTEGRYPTFPGGTRFGGPSYHRPFATASGQLDLSRGGFIRAPHVANQVQAPDTVAQVAFGTGDGTWSGFTKDTLYAGRQRTGPGGLTAVPASLGNPTSFADVLSGRYVPGVGDLDGTVAPVSYTIPGGLASIDFAHPSLGSSRARGGGGVRARQSSVGVQFVVLNSVGEEQVSPRTTLGEGGFLQTGGGQFTGDLTVDGYIDNAWKVLVAETTLAQTTGGAEQTLKSYTIPGGTMSSGDTLKVSCWGTFDNAAENGNVFLRWGGTGGTQVGFGEGSNGDMWEIEATFSITGGTSQTSIGRGVYTSAGTTTQDYDTHGQSIISDISLLLRGDNIDGTGNSAASVRGWRVEHLKAAS